MNQPSRILSRFTRAFSLVEVVLALGVVSVALTAMLGMMPVGLSIFRDSMHTTVQADILRKLSAELQNTPFDQLTNNPAMAMTFYSDQGLPVPAGDPDALLGVKYSITANTPLLAGGYDNSHLKTVKVQFFTRADQAKSPPQASLINVIYVAPGVN